jgi:glycosyltransferase involved in cell wall biosynthesis
MGIPELVEDGRSGLLVAPGRVDELAAALRRLAGDPALRASLARAGRERVLAEFDVRRSAERLAHLFAEDLGEGVGKKSEERRDDARFLAEPARDLVAR